MPLVLLQRVSLLQPTAWGPATQGAPSLEVVVVWGLASTQAGVLQSSLAEGGWPCVPATREDGGWRFSRLR